MGGCSPGERSAKGDQVTDSIANRLARIERLLSGSESPHSFVARGDRAAMRLAGFKSPTAFAAWAVAKGLKRPGVKATRQERTVYSVQALRRAALEDTV